VSSPTGVAVDEIACAVAAAGTGFGAWAAWEISGVTADFPAPAFPAAAFA
jgi:hypothetical protein